MLIQGPFAKKVGVGALGWMAGRVNGLWYQCMLWVGDRSLGTGQLWKHRTQMNNNKVD